MASKSDKTRVDNLIGALWTKRVKKIGGLAVETNVEKKGKQVVRPNLMANKVCDRILLEIVLNALLRRMNRKLIEERAVRSKSRALKLKF